MPGHKKPAMKKKNGMKNGNGSKMNGGSSNGLTAKQKKLPLALQKAILKSKKKRRNRSN